MKKRNSNLCSVFILGITLILGSIQADPIREGQVLAEQLRSIQMGIPGSIQATLKVRKRDGSRMEHLVKKHTQTFDAGWRDLFEIENDGTNNSEWLWIDHPANQPPRYRLALSDQLPVDETAFKVLDSEQTMSPLGESDFWAADLGLDFLHWPDQRLFESKITRRKGVGCKLLESSRPSRSGLGYYKVRSWISVEHGGVVYAEAFDIEDRKIKIFEVNGVEKIEGQWYLKELKIRNLRDKSTSVLEFDNTAVSSSP